jgi:hypothetical protein
LDSPEHQRGPRQLEHSCNPHRHNAYTPNFFATMNNSLYRYQGPPDKPVVCKSLPPVAIVPNPGLTYVITAIAKIPSPPNTFRCNGQLCANITWIAGGLPMQIHVSGAQFDPGGTINNGTCQLLQVQMVGLPKLLEVTVSIGGQVQAAAYVRTSTGPP